ncbi:MAG: DMT family transporter [Bacteroidota bacterium]
MKSRSAPSLSNSVVETTPAIAWVILSVLALIWGSSFKLIDVGLQVFSAVQVASLRLASAFVVMVFLAIFHLRRVPKTKIKLLILVGFLGSFIPAFLFAAAQTEISSAIAGILNSLTPLFTFIVGLLFFGQKILWKKVLGLAVGLLGAVSLILINPKGEISFNAYALLVVLATVCYACNVQLTKNYLSGIKPLHISSISLSFVGFFALIYLLSTDFTTKLQQEPQAITSFLSVFVLGIVGTAFALILFNKLLQLSSALFASSVTYFIPIVAVLLGVYYGDELSLWHILGMLAIIMGVFVINRNK